MLAEEAIRLLPASGRRDDAQVHHCSDRRSRTGPSLLARLDGTASSVSELLDQQRGGVAPPGGSSAGPKQAWFRDPAGNILSVIEG
jgi:hypothetical protein